MRRFCGFRKARIWWRRSIPRRGTPLPGGRRCPLDRTSGARRESERYRRHGAAPAWATLALTLPEADPGWLDGFARGLGELACAHGVAWWARYDRGPLTISVQILGHVPGVRRCAAAAAGRATYWRLPGRSRCRCRPRAGDRCTRTQGPRRRPRPAGALRVSDAAGRVRNRRPRIASAAMDISDGLVAICRSSRPPAARRSRRCRTAADVRRLTGGGDAQQAAAGRWARGRLRASGCRAAELSGTGRSRRAIELNTYGDRGAQCGMR